MRLQSITPSNWVEHWGSMRVLGSLTMRNPTQGTGNPSNSMLASKFFDTSIALLLAADNFMSEWASESSPEMPFNEGRIFLFKIPFPYQGDHGPWVKERRYSLVLNPQGNYRTIWFELCMTLCSLSSDAALLANVLKMSPNRALRDGGTIGSVLPPTLQPPE